VSQLDKDIIAEYDPIVHDNRITGYRTDLLGHTLTIETAYGDKEAATLAFDGVLAHRFDNVIRDNIIFDLCEVSIGHFLRGHEGELDRWIGYGYPAPDMKSTAELEDKLAREGYRVFLIGSSLGLCGHIIAKGLSISTAAL
jgi:hypothetical protein